MVGLLHDQEDSSEGGESELFGHIYLGAVKEFKDG